METWRAFTGLWQDGGFTWTSRPGLTWEQARDVLHGELAVGLIGSCCDDCHREFSDALGKLDAATPGQPVELTEIDGHDYLIVRDDVPLPRMEDDRDGLLIVRSQSG